MSTPETRAYVKSLIERASSVVGSQYRLAKLLGVPDSQVSNWKSGQRPCTAADRARIAAFAKEDAVLELIRATLEANDGTLRGEQLRAVLGNALRQIGAASVSVAVALGSLTYSPTTTARTLMDRVDTMCRKVKYRLRFA